MVAIEAAFAEAAYMVARQAEASSSVSSASETASNSDVATPTPSEDSGDGDDGGGGATSSPLLFFVALGFGVVFTNLWIIVGVKYCFRYNARNRQMRLNEDGEPMPLENMPRPHRRRREKKLMTMDEVNDKFPMMKYKSWVLERAKEGLPTEGGVSVPASRAGSIRSVEGVVPVVVSDETTGNHGSTEPTSEATVQDSQKLGDEKDDALKQGVEQGNAAPATTSSPNADTANTPNQPNQPQQQPQQPQLQRVHSDQDDDDDEHIDAALPPEMLATSGDTCAICIDTLENDDDVRGLTCGHAFHAVCVDPWLTSRRACCPLCKADYYTPKPRPQQQGEVDPNNPNATLDRNASRMNMPNAPPTAWYNLRGHRLGFGGRIGGFMPSDAARTRNARGNRRRARQQQQQSEAPATEPVAEAQPHGTHQTNDAVPRRGLGNLAFWRRNRNDNSNDDDQDQMETATASGAIVTPSQLEAGTQPASTENNNTGENNHENVVR